jgi:hypothetical protein
MHRTRRSHLTLLAAEMADGGEQAAVARALRCAALEPGRRS